MFNNPYSVGEKVEYLANDTTKLGKIVLFNKGKNLYIIDSGDSFVNDMIKEEQIIRKLYIRPDINTLRQI